MADLQILVISLPGSDTRQQKAKLELDRTGFKWQFLDAVRGSALRSTPREYDALKVRKILGFELTPNELGCFLSHKKAWQACVDQNITTLIFEDDFYLLPHFEATIQFLLHECKNWSAVRLQGLSAVSQEVIKTSRDRGFALVRNLGDAVGATAYIIKPDAAQTLIDASAEIYEPLDHFLEHYQKHRLNFLAINPYPVDITGVETTISDRPGRKPIKGFAKIKRSLNRAFDRWFSRNPWFPR
jgi:glycosyl transferase family 25